MVNKQRNKIYFSDFELDVILESALREQKQFEDLQRKFNIDHSEDFVDYRRGLSEIILKLSVEVEKRKAGI